MWIFVIVAIIASVVVAIYLKINKLGIFDNMK